MPNSPSPFFNAQFHLNGHVFMKFKKKKIVKSGRVADLPIIKLVKY